MLHGRGSTCSTGSNDSDVGLECTASHDMLHGRGSARSNGMKMSDMGFECTGNESDVGFECTASHELLHDRERGGANMPGQGFRHVYKSTKTTSSLRVHAAYKMTVLKGRPESKYTNRCDNKKGRKVDSLQEVISSEQHSLDKSFLSSQPVFYSGTTSRILPNQIAKGHMLSVIDDLQVVNTIAGAHLISTETGDTVFILIL